MTNSMSTKRAIAQFPEIPHAIATVWCTGKQEAISLTIMIEWDEFYVADEHGEQKLTEKYVSENQAFDALYKMTKLWYGEKYTIMYF